MIVTPPKSSRFHTKTLALTRRLRVPTETPNYTLFQLSSCRLEVDLEVDLSPWWWSVSTAAAAVAVVVVSFTNIHQFLPIITKFHQ